MEIPEYFVDSIQLQSGPGGSALILGEHVPASLGAGVKYHCVIRMDLIQAKILAIQLKRNLKHHEADHGVINMSPKQMEALGISAIEDWV